MSRWKWLTVGLSVIVLVGGVVFWRWGSSVGKDSKSAGQGALDKTRDAEAAARALEALEETVTAAVMEGRARSVIADLEKLVQKYPDYAPAWRTLGNVYLAAEEDERALEAYDRSLTLEPNQPALWALAGATAMKKGQVERAQKYFETAVRLDSQTARYRILLAGVHLKKQEYERARDLLLTALTIDPKAHKAYALLAETFAGQGKLSMALDQIDKAIQMVPERDRSIRRQYVRQKAELLRRANRPEEAIQVLMSLPESDRWQLEVMDDLAVCWGMMGQPGQAAAVFERRAELDPTDDQALARAAQWRIRSGDWEQARQHVARLRKINPLSPALADLERALQKGTDFQERSSSVQQ